jgi:hypothetical protein
MKSNNILISILSALVITLTIIAVIPNFREKLKSLLVPNSRKVLATIRGDLRNDGTLVSVIKVKTTDSLSLEFYEVTDVSMQMIQKEELPDQNEGYFTFMGDATNLALSNIDEDPLLEILVPTFDENLVAHLTVYKYNTEVRRFEKIATPNL